MVLRRQLRRRGLLPSVIRSKRMARKRWYSSETEQPWSQEGDPIISGGVPVEARTGPEAARIASSDVLGDKKVKGATWEVEVGGSGHGERRRHKLPPQSRKIAMNQEWKSNIKISKYLASKRGGRRPHVSGTLCYLCGGSSVPIRDRFRSLITHGEHRQAALLYAVSVRRRIINFVPRVETATSAHRMSLFSQRKKRGCRPRFLLAANSFLNVSPCHYRTGMILQLQSASV